MILAMFENYSHNSLGIVILSYMGGEVVDFSEFRKKALAGKEDAAERVQKSLTMLTHYAEDLLKGSRPISVTLKNPDGIQTVHGTLVGANHNEWTVRLASGKIEILPLNSIQEGTNIHLE